MRRLICAALLLAGFAASASRADPAAGSATALDVVEPTFRNPQVLIATSNPPQFELLFERDMPSTGWSLVVDEVEIDAEAGRILARVTEVAPEGAAAQVITSTKCSVPLGRLPRGTFVLELWSRRGSGNAHARAQALVLRAR